MTKRKKSAAVEDSASDQRVAERAKRLRLALGYRTVPAFAAFLGGIEPKRWYNVESGFPLSKELAIILVQRVPGLTLEWLWLGKTDHLTIELATRLDLFGRRSEKA